MKPLSMLLNSHSSGHMVQRGFNCGKEEGVSSVYLFRLKQWEVFDPFRKHLLGTYRNTTMSRFKLSPLLLSAEFHWGRQTLALKDPSKETDRCSE